MNKKGFTLVEVLSIIVVLGILVAIVVPRMSKSTKEIKEEQYARIIRVIENGAKAYHSNHKDEIKISVEKLQQEKLITTSLKNPINDEEINGCVRISKDSEGITRYMYNDDCDAKIVTLTVLLNGGSTTQVFENTYLEGTKLVLDTPTKNEDTFNGFVVTVGDSVIINNTLTIGSVNTTIYAMWTSAPTLTVNKNGGTSNQTFNPSYRTGTIIPLISPVKVGNIFNNWNVEIGDSIISNSTLTMGTLDTTIKANYTACEAGYFSNTSENTCVKCQNGSYSGVESGTCNTCPIGTTTSNDASTSIVSCITCPNSANVSTWNTPSWSETGVNNLCSINNCVTDYMVSNNTCIPAMLNVVVIAYPNETVTIDGDTHTMDSNGTKTITLPAGNHTFVDGHVSDNTKTINITSDTTVIVGYKVGNIASHIATASCPYQSPTYNSSSKSGSVNVTIPSGNYTKIRVKGSFVAREYRPDNQVCAVPLPKSEHTLNISLSGDLSATLYTSSYTHGAANSSTCYEYGSGVKLPRSNTNNYNNAASISFTGGSITITSNVVVRAYKGNTYVSASSQNTVSEIYIY